MIVLTLTKCPSNLKGDITKWLMEVNTGVYVGKLSARVRELLWKRICEYCGSGEAVMVFSARNEQGFSFYLYNTSSTSIDYDGLTLLRKPLPRKVIKREQDNKAKKEVEKENKKEVKKSNSVRKTTLKQRNSKLKPTDITSLIINKEYNVPLDFVALDLETTGLKSGEDSIIEVAALRYKQGENVEQYHALVKCEKGVPENIVKLTGIKNDLLEEQGKPMEHALGGLLEFIKEDIIIGHYISFDMLFLQKACTQVGIEFKQYRVIDTVAMAKALCDESIENYRLETLVKGLGISKSQEHRALPDAILAAKLYLKLNEKLKK